MDGIFKKFRNESAEPMNDFFDYIKQDAINLTKVHRWMTVSEAELLIYDAFIRRRHTDRNSGWTTVMNRIKPEYARYQMMTEKYLRKRIEIAKRNREKNS